MNFNKPDIIKVGNKLYTIKEWKGLETKVVTTCGKTFSVKIIEIHNWSFVEEEDLIRVNYKGESLTQIRKGTAPYCQFEKYQDYFYRIFGYMTNENRKFKCPKHKIFYICKEGDLGNNCRHCIKENSEEFNI